ncbi:MAG: DUF4157 domain-containing protein [Candidatus Limnocylindrales bacterium]
MRMGNELELELGGAVRAGSPGRTTGSVGPGHAPILAARAVADRRPAALDPGSIAHLQAIAGNAGVAQLLDDEAPDKVRSVLSRSGEVLEPAVAADMSSRLGADLSDVRIHRDAAASESARSVNANAYTVGSDIVFRSGQYDPSSPSGQRTLAHELSHVLQQRAGAVDGTEVGGGLALSHPSDRFEREASSAAEHLMAGDAPSPTPAPVTAAREVADESTVQRGISIENAAGDEEEPVEEEGAGLIGQRQADEEEVEEEPDSA